MAFDCPEKKQPFGELAKQFTAERAGRQHRNRGATRRGSLWQIAWRREVGGSQSAEPRTSAAAWSLAPVLLSTRVSYEKSLHQASVPHLHNSHTRECEPPMQPDPDAQGHSLVGTGDDRGGRLLIVLL